MSTQEIVSTDGRVILVDSDDYEAISKLRWRTLKPSPRSEIRYAVTGHSKYMRRMLLALTESRDRADHINGNGLDNRRSNLRKATHAQNIQNSKMRKTNRSGLKGAYFEKWSGRFRAAIQANGKDYKLGRFDTLEEAAAAYQAAALRLHGEFARPC